MKKSLLLTLVLGLTFGLANAQFNDDFSGDQANFGTVHNGTDYGAGQATITFENNQLVSNYQWNHPDWYQRSVFYDFTDFVDCGTYSTLEVKFMVTDNDYDSIPVRFDLAAAGVDSADNNLMEGNGKAWEMKAYNEEWYEVSDDFTANGRWFCTYYNGGGIAPTSIDSTRVKQFQAFSHYGDAALYTDVPGTLYIDYIRMVAPTGIKDYVYGKENLFSVALFPNPVSDYAKISSENVMKSVSVYDITGREVVKMSDLNVKKQQIDLTKLNTGAYLVKIQDVDGNSVSKKIQVR